MAEYDNTLILYDEDGEEIEFQIVDRIPYNGEEYLVLWDEESDEMAVVVERDGDYETVDDEDALEYVKKAFSSGMESLMDEADAFAVESDFMAELMEVAEGKKKVDTPSPVSTHNSETQLPSQVDTVHFDYEKYVQQSQDFLFKEATAKYNTFSFDEALSLFISAQEDGNIFAAAHIGIMYHYGEGCKQDDQKAFECFEKGYKAGCPLATAWYSECYRMGYGVTKNKEYASKLFKANEVALKELCNAEDTAALYFLGFNLIMGIGCEVNDAEGVRLLETAVFKGDNRSAVQLAECYINGWGVSADEHKGFELLMQHPVPESKKYHFLLGRCYYYGAGVEKDYSKAFASFEKSAKLGFGKAKDYLGDCYRNGQGVEKDLYEAARWYKDAADNNGTANAAHSLAFMYMNGEGVPENEKKAVDYFMIAAEGGIIQAQRIIAQEYVSGDILNRDYEAARVWMEKAANQGDAQAQLMLGRYYVSDFGYNDDQKAFEWFEKAAEQGDAEAEYTVGGCYIYEIHVKKNPAVANQWFEKAASKEHPKAMYELGISYMDGRGITKNTDKGIQYLTAAAERNSVEACEVLAKLYRDGIKNYNGQSNFVSLSNAEVYAKKLVELTDSKDAECLLASIMQGLGNTVEAKAWYQSAVNKGSDLAKLALSKMYILEGVNYSDAVSMLRTISSKKNGEAQYLLAYCLENGYGCEKDKKQAKALYSSAQANGYSENPFPRKKKFGLF